MDPTHAAREVIPAPGAEPFAPAGIRRPDRSLLWYYVFISLLTGPMFPLVLIPLFFKYETLTYRFDDSGVSMSWGILFRQEIYLTYRRIQDIHLTRNLIQRWLGLATVAVQTAAGSSGPEMSIEGILRADALRDFLYSRMRGAREPIEGGDRPLPGEPTGGPSEDEALILLREIRDLVHRLVTDREASR